MAFPNRPPPPLPMGSQNTVFITEVRFDPSYLRTPAGLLKLIVILLNFLGFICIISSAFWSNGRGVYFNIVAHLGLWFSLIMLTLYLYHVVEKYHNIKWLKIEMITYIVLMFLNLIASTIVVAFGNAGYSAAGFFGYLAMVCYGLDAFFKAQALKAGELAQGQRVLTKQVHNVPSSPAIMA